jgi:hypothetical protein
MTEYERLQETAQRKFQLNVEEKPGRVVLTLDEQEGLEHKINIGILRPARTSRFAYDGRKIREGSVRNLVRYLAIGLREIEDPTVRTHTIKESIPEFEKLIREEEADMQKIAKAYWFLERRKPEKLDYQQIRDCLENAREEAERNTTPLVLVTELHPLSRIWIAEKMLLGPLTYYTNTTEHEPSIRLREDLYRLGMLV